MKLATHGRKVFFVLFSVIVFIFSVTGNCRSSNADNLGFLSPIPTGNTINDAWTPDGENFFFAGDGGTIIFYDGSNFTVMPTPTNHALFGIHGTSMTDIWAVGGDNYDYTATEQGRSMILHYDGSSWTAQSPPSDGWGQYHAFSDVWCDGSGVVWAVAEYTTLIAKFNGDSWSYIDTGISLSNFGFHAIYGFSPTDIYAAGGCGQIIHNSGGTWVKERQEGDCSTMSFDLLYDIWGPDADNVFATGNYSQALKRNTDGTWDTLYSGSMFSDASKNCLSGVSASEVYFAGLGGELDLWNAENYTRILSIYSDKDQNVIVPNAAGKYYIGMAYGKISEFNGLSRTIRTTPPVLDKDWKFAQRAERIWLCKESLNSGDTIYAWDGATLSVVNPGIEAQFRITTLKVFGENDIYLSGYELGGFGTLAKHYNGSTWSNVSYGNGLLVDVALSGADVFVISNSLWDNDMDEYLGAPCINGDCYGDSTFKAMVLGDDGKIYAVGKGGAIVSYADGGWSVESSGTTKDLTSVAAGGGWVCAAGRDRTVVCKNGTGNWNGVTGLAAKTENKFLGIAYSGDASFVAMLNTGNDGDYSYAGGDKGTLYKINAGTATLLRTGMSSILGGVGSNAAGEFAVAGTGGVIYGNILTPQPKPTPEFTNLIPIFQLLLDN